MRSVPNYKVTGHGDTYFPRNTAGTLYHAAEMLDDKCEFIVLCDPDMIFLRQPAFSDKLSGAHYPYLNYNQDHVRAAMEK
ncbi:MAG: hypothetical protein WKF84_05495 [Pyrinomonadaceae bacterium]